MVWGPEGGNKISMFRIIMATIEAVSCVGLLVYLLRARRRARRSSCDGQTDADRVIFPQYFYVLYFYAFACAFQAGVNIGVPFVPHKVVYISLFAVGYGLSHMVFEGISFMLCCNGVGQRATVNSTQLALLWGVVTTVMQAVIMHCWGTIVALVASSSWNGLVLVYYASLWLVPSRVLFRRPALVRYAAFWFVCRLVAAVAEVLIFYKSNLGYCVQILSSPGILSAVLPYVVYVALLSDSKYWQGTLDMPGQKHPRVFFALFNILST